MKKVKLIGAIAFIIINSFCLTAYAATTASQYWQQQTDGAWLINKPGVGTVKNAWVCDNFNNPADTDSNWYYLTADGKMAEGVLIDNGKAYVLEYKHEGNYGMMLSGTASVSLNSHTLTLNTNHDGSFGCIKAVDGNSNFDINSLGALLGVKQSTAVAGAVSEYTANWGSSGGNGSAGGNGAGGSQMNGGQVQAGGATVLSNGMRIGRSSDTHIDPSQIHSVLGGLTQEDWDQLNRTKFN